MGSQANSQNGDIDDINQLTDKQKLALHEEQDENL